MVDIESDIPIPLGSPDLGVKPSPMGGRPEMYPWSKMKVGDSMFIPNRKGSVVSTMASYRKRHHGERHTVRTVEGGVRVWRIA